MATNQGTITFNFGAAPGTNVVSAVVADAAIGASSNIEIYLSGLDSTVDHNAYEHGLFSMLAPIQLTPISRTAGVGFTGQMATQLRLTGTVKCRYVWAD